MLEADHFKGNLFLASGHILVWAWYLATWQALQAKDQPWLLRLWECGLTVSVRAREVSTNDGLRAVLLDSWSFSEATAVVQLAGSESSVVFAQKLMSFIELNKADNPKQNQDSIIKSLASLGVRYKGSIINMTMFKTATNVHALLDDVACQQMEKLEWMYGSELLSSSYNKLGRFLSYSQKASTVIPNSFTEVCLLFALQMVEFSLEEGLVRSPKFFYHGCH